MGEERRGGGARWKARGTGSAGEGEGHEEGDWNKEFWNGRGRRKTLGWGVEDRNGTELRCPTNSLPLSLVFCRSWREWSRS